MSAALGFVFGVVAELQKRILVGRSHQDHIAAAAAIAAARPAPRDELLAAERKAAVTAIAGLHQNSGFIEKQHGAGGLASPRPCGCGSSVAANLHHFRDADELAHPAA